MKTIIKMLPIMIVFSWIHLSAQIVNNPDVIICPSCVVSCATIFEQKENAVYINPINNQIAIVGNNSHDKPNPYTASVFITTDGGQTWDENYSVQQSSYDPTVAIDNAGHYYLGRINSGEIFVSKFDDLFNQGLWENVVVDNINSPDKPHIWINNNTIYCVWTRTQDSQTDPKLHVYISKADINSFTTSWQMPVKVNSNVAGTFSHHGANVKTGPLGQVYVVWSIYDIPFNSTFGTKDEDAIGFAKLDQSTLQQTFSSRLINIRGTRGSGIINTGGILNGSQITMFPSIAVNQQNGHLYLAWTNIGVPGSNTGDPDIYFIKSNDEGVNWTSPIRVNQDIISNNKNQYYPTIACDPITGVIAIGYLDSRDNHPQENYYVSLSADEGQSWYDYQVSDASFVSTSGTANDYTWLDIKNNYIVPVWNENILDPGCPFPYDNAFTSPFSIACTSDVNNLCNINESGSQFFKASNTISVAGNSSNCYYNILASGGNVAFQAGNNVKLAEGFHSEYGSTMHSYINTNCNLVGNFTIGGSQKVVNTVNTAVHSNEQSENALKNFKVYPNPTQNKIYVTFNLQQDEQINVTLNDITGGEILILNKSLNKGFYKTALDLNENNLQPGIYFLKLSTSREIKSIKFVKL